MDVSVVRVGCTRGRDRLEGTVFAHESDEPDRTAAFKLRQVALDGRLAGQIARAEHDLWRHESATENLIDSFVSWHGRLTFHLYMLPLEGGVF